MEEEKRRSSELQDLMVIQSPEEIQRNQQIEDIKKLYNVQRPENGLNTPYLSSAPIFFGSDRHRGYSQSSTLPSSMSLPQMVSPPSTPFIPAQSSNPFYMPLTQSQSATINRNPTSPVLSTSPPSNSLAKQNSEVPQHNPFVASTSNTHSVNLANYTLPTPLPNNFSQISPLKIPFRPTNGGDLIDLQSWANDPERTAMEEFDPLYKKLSLQETANTILSSTSSPELNAQLDKAATSAQDLASRKKTNPALSRAAAASFKSRQMSFDHKTLLTCEDLKICEESSCDFYKEKALLMEQTERLKCSPTKSSDVFFLAPMVDYFTTTADSIKLVVYQDDTWRRDIPGEPQKLEFACDLRSTSEEILVDVLLRLLPQEVIDKNGGDIPLAEYALKVYGFDEFLVPSAVIGKHPFVAHFLSQGKDVVLEVGKRVLVPTAEESKYVDNPSIVSPVVNKELFHTFSNTIKSHVEKCLENPQDRKLRQGVVQSVKMLTTFMNNVQPPDLVSAIDMLYAGNSLQELSNAVHSIVLAVMRLLKMYCTSTLTDFSFLHSQQKNNKLTWTTSGNLPISTYKAYFVEAHLMYGPKSYGLMSSDPRSITSKYHFSFVSFQFWAEFEVQLPSLPRESQVCFIVRGIPIVEGPEGGVSNGCTSAEIYAAHRIATVSLPLYNHEGFLLQGPVLLPLTLMNAEDPVLVVKCLEYEYQIRFPDNIFKGKIHWQEFEELPSETQNELLMVLGDGGVNSTNLNDDDKQFLWTKRNYLHHMPKALPLVLASSFSWGSYSLSNIYLLLEKWASLLQMLLLSYFCPIFKTACLLTQFVEALRYETFENSALAVFLLEQSTRDRRFAFELYWQLQHRIHDTRNLPTQPDVSYCNKCCWNWTLPGSAVKLVTSTSF
uniref:Uncharacterized protein n=1 Tax=Ditylenchus dipsaci TaxID=166011 RepID=A0A915D232_9BILA